MNTKNITDKSGTQEGEANRAQEGRAQGQAGHRRGARIAEAQSEEDGQGPAEALGDLRKGAAARRAPVTGLREPTTPSHETLFRTKSIDALIAASRRARQAPDARRLGPWSLTALGIGAVIGSGIFILTGTAAAGETLAYQSILHAPLLDLLLHGANAVSTIGRPGAGPAISLSFLLTALACAFAALCYAELASMIPDRGQRLHLRLRHAGRDLRLDDRLGPDSGVRRLEHGRGGGLLGVFQRHPGAAAFGFDLPRALAEPMIAGRALHGRLVQPAGAGGAAAAHLDAGARRQGERRNQQRDGAASRSSPS